MAQHKPATGPAPREGTPVEVSFEGSSHVTTLSPLRLGMLRGAFGDWRFDPVPEGALVVLVHAPLYQGAPWKTQLHGARADKDGMLFRLDASNPKSREGRVQLCLPAPERYYAFWTLNEARYEEALTEPLWLIGESTLIELRRYAAPTKLLLEELDELDAGDGFYQRQDARKIIRNHILQRHTFYEESGRPYEATYERDAVPFFDVTPKAVRSLFMVETMQWYAMRTNELAAPSIATMNYVAAMADAAEKGLKDKALELRAQKLFVTDAEKRLFECFRDYVWRCAATGVDPRTVEESLSVTAGATTQPTAGTPELAPDGVHTAPAMEPWYGAAQRARRASEGRKHGPAVHPYFRNVTGSVRAGVLEGPLLTESQCQLIVSYYECYRFGAALRVAEIDNAKAYEGRPAGRDFRTRLTARTAQWTKLLDVVIERCAAILSKHVDVEKLALIWCDCYPHEEDLVQRYFEASAHCDHAWWRVLVQKEQEHALERGADGRPKSPDWPFWKTFKARVKPSAEVSKGASKLCKFLAERAAGLRLGAQEANLLLGAAGRLELALTGHEVDATRHALQSEKASVRLLPGADGEVLVELSPAARADKPGMTRKVMLRLAREIEDVAMPGSVAAGTSPSRTLRPEPHFKFDPVEVVLPAHVNDLEQAGAFSPGWGILAETLNVAIGLVTVLDRQAKGKDQFFATFDVTKGVVAVLKDLPSALAALRPALKESEIFKSADKSAASLKETAKLLGRIDSAFKVYKGLMLLFSDNADVAQESKLGRPFRAQLYRYADWANMAIGGANSVELAGTALVAAAGPEVLGGWTGAAATFTSTGWGLLISVGGAVIAAGAMLALDLTQPWSEAYMRVENAWSKACESEVRGKHFRVSDRLASLIDAVNRSDLIAPA